MGNFGRAGVEASPGAAVGKADTGIPRADELDVKGGSPSGPCCGLVHDAFSVSAILPVLLPKL